MSRKRKKKEKIEKIIVETPEENHLDENQEIAQETETPQIEYAAADLDIDEDADGADSEMMAEAMEEAEDTADSDRDSVVEAEAEADFEFEVSAEDEETTDDGMSAEPQVDVGGTELEAFESEEIEDLEFLTEDQVISIVESVLFATDKPQSLATIRQAFKGTNVKTPQIRRAIAALMQDYAETRRGFTLEEIQGGYQLRSKVDNMNFLKGMVKARPFRLSGPALEVLAIIAYKQPCTKHEVDEIRGVESGHLLRGLMDRGLVNFGGKSDLPGKPMLYETTRKFLEIFGLRNLKELPSLSEIDQLIPEGIGDEADEDKVTLDVLTDQLSEQVGSTYSEGEEELGKITDQLAEINTSSEFFEKEKQRQKEQRDRERAQDIRDALAVGDEVADKDKRWLEKYEATLAAIEAASQAEAEAAHAPEAETQPNEVETLEASEESALDEALESSEAPESQDEFFHSEDFHSEDMRSEEEFKDAEV